MVNTVVNTTERRTAFPGVEGHPIMDSHPVMDNHPVAEQVSHALRSQLSPCPRTHTALDWSAPHPQAGCHVFRGLEDMARLWGLHGGDVMDLPSVNFQANLVLAVFGGEGYFRESLTIGRFKHTPEALWVYVFAYTRRWQTINPMSVIQIAKTDKPIRFVRLG
ncbi:MAG: hypothetical protein HC857_13475 [Synechococcales cyanobacterium RU_4_20]|nr:hypothetical protein [Synechococcales cyanobacterium RU_4_20]NJR68276.1 hypothetical protein [Synechococcales cyanobacterium CRU_2_2]